MTATPQWKTVLDARTTLKSFMADEMPDREAFLEVVTPRAQAALLALRDVSVHTSDAVLERAKEYYSERG